MKKMLLLCLSIIGIVQPVNQIFYVPDKMKNPYKQQQLALSMHQSKAAYAALRKFILQSDDIKLKTAYQAQVYEHVQIINKALSGSAEDIFRLLDLDFTLKSQGPILGLPLKGDHNSDYHHYNDEMGQVLNHPCRELSQALRKIFLDKKGRFRLKLSSKEQDRFAQTVNRYLKQILSPEEYEARIKGYVRDGVPGFEKVQRLETGTARPGEKMMFHVLGPIRALGDSLRSGPDVDSFNDNIFNRDVRRVVALCKEKRFDDAKNILNYYKRLSSERSSETKKIKKEAKQNCDTLANIISQYAEVDGKCFTALMYEHQQNNSLLQDKGLSHNARQVFQTLGLDDQDFEAFEGTMIQNQTHNEITQLINEVSELLAKTNDVYEEGFLLSLFDNALAAYEINKLDDFSRFSEVVDDIIITSKYAKKYTNSPRYHVVRYKTLSNVEFNAATRKMEDLALLTFDSYMGSMNRTPEAQQSRCFRNFNIFRRYAHHFPGLSQDRFDELALEIFLPASRYHQPGIETIVSLRQRERDTFLDTHRNDVRFCAEVYKEQYELLKDMQSDYIQAAHDAYDAGDMEKYNRYMNRVQTIFEAGPAYQNIQRRAYSLSDKGQELLRKGGYNPQRLISMEGNVAQLQLHQELVDIIEKTAHTFHEYELRDSQVFQRTVVDFVDLANLYNESGCLYEGNRVVDFCWGIVDCTAAAGEGMVDGSLAVAQYVYDHPFETTAFVVTPKVAAIYKLSQLTASVGSAGYDILTSENKAATWNEYMRPLNEVVQHLTDVEGNLNIPKTIKTGTQVATQIYLGLKLQKSLNDFYKRMQQGALELAKRYKTPDLERILATPDGRLINAGRNNAKGILYKKAKPNGSSNNVNAQINLDKKMRALQKAQQQAVKVVDLKDGRIRYYRAEKLAHNLGSTRGASYVTEYNTKTGQVRSWMECYDHAGNVNRVHPKMIDGQEVVGQHYPPTEAELKLFSKVRQ